MCTLLKVFSGWRGAKSALVTSSCAPSSLTTSSPTPLLDPAATEKATKQREQVAFQGLLGLPPSALFLK